MSLLTFGMAVPHSYLLYKIIWADPCSAAFFTSYEIAMSWIAVTSALEGSAAVGLGYIDYKLVTGNSDEMILAMRKKRLAFAKFSFLMAAVALLMLDKPSPHCVLPMLIGQGYSAMKLGT